MVKVRFAPSPTGKLHLGSARTAVFNWLYAKHTRGKLILRIEDTDLGRSEDAYTQSIIRDMRWMGMDYDEFYKQSDRFDIYRSYAERLLSEGKAYYCTCSREEVVARSRESGETAKYDGHCRDRIDKPEGAFVVRLNIGSERDIVFKDIVKNKLTFNTKELDDYVIMKSDGSPTYNFAVVVDDASMGMTHIIRGEDHITNTAKQIILYEYLNLPLPEFAHLPLVMGKDKAPLSKRKGSTNIEYYRAMGILPEALLNAIARLGWSHGNDEVFTMEQLIKFFDIAKINKSNAVYDEDKMVWVNGKHMKILPPDMFSKHFEEFLAEAGLSKQGKMMDENWLSAALGSLRSRHSTLKSLYDEIVPYGTNQFKSDPAASKILEDLMARQEVAAAFNAAKEAIMKADTDFPAGLEDVFRKAAEEAGVKFGELIQALRIRLTGQAATPDILSVIKLLGQEGKERLK